MLIAQRDQNAFKALPRGERGDAESEKLSPFNDAEPAKNNKDLSEEEEGAAVKDLSSPVAASPAPESARGLNAQSPAPPVLNEGLNTEQVRNCQCVCV